MGVRERETELEKGNRGRGYAERVTESGGGVEGTQSTAGPELSLSLKLEVNVEGWSPAFTLPVSTICRAARCLSLPVGLRLLVLLLFSFSVMSYLHIGLAGTAFSSFLIFGVCVR